VDPSANGQIPFVGALSGGVGLLLVALNYVIHRRLRMG